MKITEKGKPEYKYLPCNSGYCPFGSSSMETCKIHCGLTEDKDKENSNDE